MSSTITNVDAALKRVLVESREVIYPEDLIERAIEIDFSYAFGPIKKVYAVHGLRRIGKTYLLYQLRKQIIEQGIEPPRTHYINMEDERKRHNVALDLIE